MEERGLKGSPSTLNPAGAMLRDASGGLGRSALADSRPDSTGPPLCLHVSYLALSAEFCLESFFLTSNALATKYGFQ